MVRKLTGDERRVLKIASARSSKNLSIGGGEKKIKPKPITMPTIPEGGPRGEYAQDAIDRDLAMMEDDDGED